MWSKSYLDLLGVTVDNLIPRENSLNHTTASSSKVMQLTPPSPGSSSAGLLSSLAANASLPAQHPYLMTPGSHHPLNSLPPLLQHQPNSSLNWELIQRFLVASSAAAGHPLLPVQQQQLQLQQQQLFFSQAGMTGQHFLSPSQQQARLKFSIENILSPTFGSLGDEQPSLKSKSVPDSSSSSSKRLLVPSSSLSNKRKNSSDSEKSTTSSSSNSRYLVHPHLPASSSSQNGHHHLPSNNNHNKNSHKKSPKKEDASSPGIVSSTSGSPSSSSSSSFSLSCNKFNSKNNNNNHVKNTKKEDDMKQVDCTGKQQLDSDGSLVKPVTSSKDSGLSSGSSSSSNTSSEYNFKPDSQGDANARPSLPSLLPTLDGKEPMVWPAWVYCTRYSDRPSSGPRSRRTKKSKAEKKADEKRPRTAFTAEQLARLKQEFQENRYLTEKRRQDLARDLKLNESQIKIWFQNKRAKIKKTTGHKNPLALHLMAQGLYNHTTASMDDEDEDEQLDVDDRATSAASSSSPHPPDLMARNMKSPLSSTHERTGSISSPDPSIADHSMSSEQ